MFMEMEWRLARDARSYTFESFLDNYGHDRGLIDWNLASERGRALVPPSSSEYTSSSESTDSTQSTAVPSTELPPLRAASASTVTSDP